MSDPPPYSAPIRRSGRWASGFRVARAGTSRRILGLMPLLSALLIAAAWAGGWQGGPRWTVGRGVIVAHQPDAPGPSCSYLRISLRNLGQPGRVPVAIYGRWYRSQGPGGKLHASPNGSRQSPRQWPLPPASSRENLSATNVPTAVGPDPGMKCLGRYRREVGLVSTAILEVPLRALGRPQPEVTGLELVVMTANHLTGRGMVALGRGGPESRPEERTHGGAGKLGSVPQP